MPVFFIVPAHLPRRNVIRSPNRPITPIPTMTRPMGTRVALPDSPEDGVAGSTKGPGGVKVGNRVGGISMMNCAARVGSTVGVVRGVGVGGGSTTGTLPTSSTRGE